MTIAMALFAAAAQAELPYTWRSAELGGGGFVTGVITHPRAKNVVYCRTDIGGAYRMDPRTRAWIPLQDWLPRSQWNWYGVESLALDPSDPRRVVMAVGTYTNDWAGNGAILRSGDQGRTWKITELPFKNGGNMDGRSIGERLAIDPGDGRIIYFGTRLNGLWRSRDAGATWDKVESFPKLKENGIGIGWVIFGGRGRAEKGPSQTILAGPAVAGEPIFRSRDGGQTWSAIPGSPPQIPHHAELAEDGTLYAAYSSHPGPNGVTDGAVWKLAPSGEWTDITPLKPTPEKGFGYAGLSLDRSRPGTLIASTLCRWGADTIFLSRDGGRSWTSLAERSRRDVGETPFLLWGRDEADFGHWIGDCEIDPFQPDRAWYVTGATIYETAELGRGEQGGTIRWVPSTRGLEETAVIDIFSPPSGPQVVYAVGDIGAYAHWDIRKPQRQGVWTNPLLGTTTSIDFAQDAPSVYVRVGSAYSPGPRGGISRDMGKTWTPFRVLEGPGGASNGHVAINAPGRVILWCPDGGRLMRSLDDGATWEPAAGPPGGCRPFSDRVISTVFYAQAGKSGPLWASDDLGRTFEKMGDLPPGEVGRVKAVPQKAGELWAPASTGLYFSHDRGRTWVRVNGVESAESVGFGKAADGSAHPALFIIGRVMGREGVFRSVDHGSTWGQVNNAQSGFGTMMHVSGDPRVFGRAYVGTNGRGLIVFDPRR